jgi:aspartate carbamoyltransferase catalytic subunit
MTKNLIDPQDLSVAEIDGILTLAQKIIDDPDRYSEVCKRKKLATLFFEPSTRTRLSFEAAMLELGGSILGFSSAASSSATKGESVGDTVKIVSCYADIIAMRHPKEGAPMLASMKSDVPIINAGDGGHSHPTQTLTDLLTIKREKGRLNNLTIGLCGDLMFGRTVHSLIKAMSRYEGIKFILISPDELKIPDYIRTEVLDRNNIPYKEVYTMDEVMGELDVLYMTRVQKERFFNEADYIRLKDTYILDSSKLALARPDMSILHPLPRVNEIAVEVDDDPRACYFRQALNGKYVRMALIMTLLGLVPEEDR